MAKTKTEGRRQIISTGSGKIVYRKVRVPLPPAVALEIENEENARVIKRVKDRVSGAVRNARLRQTVFKHYGWRCKCCGISYPPALSMDHIEGGGRQEKLRNKETGGGVAGLYKRIIAEGFPSRFQTMCLTCNHAKHLMGECRCKEWKANPELEQQNIIYTATKNMLCGPWSRVLDDEWVKEYKEKRIPGLIELASTDKHYRKELLEPSQGKKKPEPKKKA